MKAIVCPKYGSPEVLQIKEVDKPIPKPNEIRVRVYATTVTTGDCRVRGFNSPLVFWIPMRLFLGIRKPRQPILGVELAGEVEAVGQAVTQFKKGDRVFALTGMRFGGYAEYACLPENSLVAPIPAQVAYEEAAVVAFGGTTSLHFFRKGNLQRGHKVLIYGASGAVGTSAIQLAKHSGAEVTAVCSSANADLVSSLGADHVIDYTKENFWERRERYDIVFDAVGKSTKSACIKALAPGGRYLTVDGQGVAVERREDMYVLKELMENGLLKPVIDRRYAMEQIADAHRYVESGRKKGNVVVAIR
ncbi:NAD(P)-dependent alcohol dehydrogenase [Paenibacillus sp. 1011MAR3C5]|uniref:NAD(P)-dependent alcohol dehydrogenase n=1 Tax=Paenibacillus sp. 1011MAR3C5 TaxID=1675787 RepID=UPI000E6C805A|nr:NAD(P)-dependent alcohol dehydrogenase [Paenibacillus sp. 1011MAR3C5]RJE89629.1 NAD(P)-dependent alcohol dehydrogenase [Paenibacillus sp. 1011MAR3C5]